MKQDKYLFFRMNFKTFQNLTKNSAKLENQNTAGVGGAAVAASEPELGPSANAALKGCAEDGCCGALFCS